MFYKNDYLKLAHSAVCLHKDSRVMTWQNWLVIQLSQSVIDRLALTPNQTLTCWICSDLPGLREVLGCVWEPQKREKPSRRNKALKKVKKIPAAWCKVWPLSVSFCLSLYPFLIWSWSCSLSEHTHTHTPYLLGYTAWCDLCVLHTIAVRLEIEREHI